MKTDYAHGCDHASRNLRYLGVAEEAPAVRSRRDTQWRTSIQSKQRDKYETNEISENVGGWSGLCNGGGDRASAANHNHYYDSRPGNRYNHNSGDNNQQCRYNRDIHSGFGLFYVPNSAECGAGTAINGAASLLACPLPPAGAGIGLLPSTAHALVWGGKAAGRDRSSSRLQASRTVSRVGTTVTVHMRLSPGGRWCSGRSQSAPERTRPASSSPRASSASAANLPAQSAAARMACSRSNTPRRPTTIRVRAEWRSGPCIPFRRSRRTRLAVVRA